MHEGRFRIDAPPLFVCQALFGVRSLKRLFETFEAAPWLRATVFFAGSQRRKQMALPHVQNEGAWLDPMKRWVARRSAPVTPSVPYPLLKAPIENLGFAP